MMSASHELSSASFRTSMNLYSTEKSPFGPFDVDLDLDLDLVARISLAERRHCICSLKAP